MRRRVLKKIIFECCLLIRSIRELIRERTDPSIGDSRGVNCVAGLECILNIIRALRMGSCLSVADSRNSLSYSPSSDSGVKKPKKKRISSFDSKREEQLHRIPGRMFLNGATNVASLFTQQGRKGTNQDAMVVWESFGSRTDTVFCGVFDGHGPYGHMVAKKVRDSLPLKLSAHWEVNIGKDDGVRENSSSAIKSMNSEQTASMCMDEEPRVSVDTEEKEKKPDIFLTLKESFLKAFKVMDKELRLHPNIDCFCSGTTAVTLVKQGQDLVIGNIGDSRAVLGTRGQDDSLIAVQLTVDLKPNLPREAERIRKCRGRVFALQDEPDVARVWLPNNDSPGLAMARAFGDFCLKDFGLISVPDISYRRLTEKDEFVVLATDGIWDVLSNSEVVNIVASALARSSAARALVEAAVRAWRFKYPTSKVDDCAVVCLFFDSNTTDSARTTKEDEPASLDPTDAMFASDGNQEVPSTPNSLVRSGTLKTCLEILPEEGEESSQQWSALDGVSRVNTLLTLPRFGFGPGGDQKGSPDTKIKK